MKLITKAIEQALPALYANEHKKPADTPVPGKVASKGAVDAKTTGKETPPAKGGKASDGAAATKVVGDKVKELFQGKIGAGAGQEPERIGGARGQAQYLRDVDIAGAATAARGIGAGIAVDIDGIEAGRTGRISERKGAAGLDDETVGLSGGGGQ